MLDPVSQCLGDIEDDPAVSGSVDSVDVLKLALSVFQPQNPIGGQGEGGRAEFSIFGGFRASVKPKFAVEDPLVCRGLAHVEPESLAALVSDPRHVVIARREGHYDVALVNGLDVGSTEAVQGVLVDVQEKLGSGPLDLGTHHTAVLGRSLGQTEKIQDLVFDLALLALGHHPVYHGLVEAVVHVETAHAVRSDLPEDQDQKK